MTNFLGGFIVFFLAGAGNTPAGVVVAQDGSGDFNGTSEVPIIEALESCGKTGTVWIRRGTYTIDHTINLDGAENLTIRGEKGTVLQFPALPYTTVVREATVGTRSLFVESADVFKPETRVRVKAPGRTVIHHGKPRGIPAFEVTIASVSGTSLTLEEPLLYPVPKGTPIAFAENLFFISRGRNLTLENLVLDGNRSENDPGFIGHATLCTFFADGPYDYEKGPTGPPVQGLRFQNCVFRNAAGRCIAWYSVVNSEIKNCTIENTPDAGVDIDHFCYDITVSDNRIRNCKIGVEINDGSRCRIDKNRIQDVDKGVTIWRWCSGDDLNVDNLVIGNHVANWAAYGIRLEKNTRRNRVLGNLLKDGKGVGISAEGDESLVKGNRVMKVDGECFRDEGTGNRFTNNVCDGTEK